MASAQGQQNFQKCFHVSYFRFVVKMPIDAREENVFRLARDNGRRGCARAAAARERRVREAGVNTDVFVEKPVQARRPGLRGGSRRGRIGKHGKRGVVNVQLRITPDHLQRAPLAVMRIKRMQRRNAGERGIFPGQHPAAGNFPGRIVQIGAGARRGIADALGRKWHIHPSDSTARNNNSPAAKAASVRRSRRLVAL